jgi:putative membrane protein
MKYTFIKTVLALTFGLVPLIPMSAATNGTSNSDEKFATKAAAGGMAEVQMGELGLKNASSADVKAFARKMVDDHTKAGNKLKQTAAKENIPIPSSMDAKDQAIYDRLSKLQGAAFDKAYMADMVKDHKADVAEFQKESNNGSNPDMKQFASETLPTLQEHLKMAEDTYAKVK